MNRNERRHPRGNVRKIPTLEEMAIEKAGIYIANTAKIINECYFNAMRGCGISAARAKKIIVETEKLIELEANK